MFDVLAEQDSKFRQIQPCVIVIGHGSEGAQMPNLVFQSTGGHRVLIQINEVVSVGWSYQFAP